MLKEQRQKILEKIGDTIQSNRKKKNISQEQLGQMFGLTKSAISRYEGGKTEIPASILPIISETLMFSMNQYWEDKELKTEEALQALEELAEYYDRHGSWGIKTHEDISEDVKKQSKRERDAAINVFREYFSQNKNTEIVEALCSGADFLHFVRKYHKSFNFLNRCDYTFAEVIFDQMLSENESLKDALFSICVYKRMSKIEFTDLPHNIL